MKKIKLLLWLIVLGLIALVVYQNKGFVLQTQAVEVNLWIQHYNVELSIGVILLGFFLAGLLISYFFSLAQRFKTRKTIKKLNEELTIERKKVAELESQRSKEDGTPSFSEPATGSSPAPEAVSGQGQ